MKTEKITDEQRTLEWFNNRLGVPTSSMIHKAIGKGRGANFTQIGYSYMMELIAETFTGQTKQISGAALDWGTEHEPTAIEAYEVETMQKVQPTGLWCLTDESVFLFGGSPDGLVGDDGIIEVKCPYNTANFLEYFITNEVPKEYYWQCQGNMLVTDRKWCDFIAFDPRVSTRNIYIKRIDRNEDDIKLLKERVQLFNEEYAEKVSRIK